MPHELLLHAASLLVWRLTRVLLEQEVSETRDSYLRAEVERLEDREDEDSEEVATAEAKTEKLFLDIVDTQVVLA